MSAGACRVDFSRETGSLVVCSCGFAMGPFMDHGRAREVARAHRNVHAEPKPKSTPEERERHNAKQREKRRAERAARRDT